MFAEFDQENPTNPTLIIITCADVITSFGFMAFFMIIGVNLDIRFTNKHDIVWLDTSSPHSRCLSCALWVSANYVKRVMSTWTTKSNQNITLHRLLACLQVHKCLFMLCLPVSLCGKFRMPVRASYDYSSVIYYKITAIFQYVSKFLVYIQLV